MRKHRDGTPMDTGEIEKIVDLCLKAGEHFTDEMRMIFEDMCGNAKSLADVERNIELIKDALTQIKY